MERLGTSARSTEAGPGASGQGEALVSALERIVFLECRVEQLSAAAAAERESAARAREALAAAAAREAEEVRRRAELEAALAAGRAERAELLRRLGAAEAGRAAAEAARHGHGEGLARELAEVRVALATERRTSTARALALSDAHARIADLEAAREQLFARLVAWQRACNGSGDGFDLAEFIAELRREIVALEASRDEGRRRENALRMALDRAGVDPEAALAAEGAPTLVGASPQDAAAAGGAPGLVPAAAGGGAPGAPVPAGASLPEALGAGGLPGVVQSGPGGGVSRAPGMVSAAASEASGADGTGRDGSRIGGDPAGEAAPRGGEGGDIARDSAENGDIEDGGPGAALAARFASVGRLGISPDDIDASLAGMGPAEGRLARRLAAEVAAGPAPLRLRAASRLVELAGRRAAVALAAAAGSEPDPPLRASLVEALGKAGEPHAFPRLAHFLDDDAPEVRAAAVEACVRLAEGAEVQGTLRRGLVDPEPKVRRRAALAAAGARNLDPGPLLAPLLLDPDRQVRRLAAAALGGTADPGAALALFTALLDPEATVREAAADAAARLFGGDLRALVTLPPLERGRAVARLRAHVTANLARLAPDGKLRPQEFPVAAFAALEAEEQADGAAHGEQAEPIPEQRAAEAPAAAPEGRPAEAAEPAPEQGAVEAPAAAPECPPAEAAGPMPEPRAAEAPNVVSEGRPAEAPEPVAAEGPQDGSDSAEAPGAEPEVSFEAVQRILRAWFRGATVESLARELGCDGERLAPAVEGWLASGQLIRRGKKVFLP